MALIIGLTGSIATGKSTVAKMFHDFNIPVVDADKIAREVVNLGEEAYNEIVQAFGKGILHENGTIDRQKLGAIVFANAARREQLNRIVHPKVRESLLKKRDDLIRSGATCVVLDIPLLFESGLTGYVEKVIVVYADEEVQMKRLMARNGYTEEEARQRILSQLSVKEKAKMADAVINNNGTIDETCKQLEELLQQWEVII